MAGNARTRRRPAPVVFVTDVRKIEPFGDDCVRFYCSIPDGTGWEDRVIIEIPRLAAVRNNRFIASTIIEISDGLKELELAGALRH